MIQPKRFFTVALTAVTIGLTTLAGSTASGQPEGKQPPVRQPEPKQPEGRQPGRPGEGRGQSVEGSMKVMNRAMNQLSEQIGDASKKDENLRLIGEMERGCAGAKNVQPNKIRDIKDETQRAKVSIAYRKHLIEVMRKLLDVEESIMADKTDAAKAQLEAVATMRDAGHKELGVDED